MNRENWEKEFDATLTEDNDANDYYYKWLACLSEEGDILAIANKWLGVDIVSQTKVRIKVFKGAIFIQRVDPMP